MKFVADESVDFPVIEILRENNFDVFLSPKQRQVYPTMKSCLSHGEKTLCC